MTTLSLAGYIRVSHVGGRAGDRFRSPDEQQAEITRWATAHGHDVVFLPPELDGKGNDADRPIFRRAVEGVKNREYGGVCVAYLSRAGRDLRLMLDMWTEVEAAGGGVYSARENIDSTTPSGRLHRNVLASIAQHELEERREGFKRSRAGAVERGIWKQRQTPRGYSRDPDTRRLVPNDDAPEVVWAFEARAAGVSIAAIADRLGMTAPGVRRLLANDVYLGVLRDGEYVNPCAHPALVSVELFARAQVSVPQPPRVHAAPALLAGLVRCSGCGHLLTRAGGFYAHPRQRNGVRCPAPAAISIDALDRHVEAIALGELARIQLAGVVAGDDAERAREQVAAATHELTVYVQSVSAADLGADAFAAGARKRREAVEAAERELRAALACAPLAQLGLDGVEAWHVLDGHERNVVLRALLAAVVVERAGGRGSRRPLADRVRVIRAGADMPLPVRRGGEAAAGVRPIPLADLRSPDVLRVSAREDRP